VTRSARAAGARIPAVTRTSASCLIAWKRTPRLDRVTSIIEPWISRENDSS
jgi:hypothetical protein